MKELHVNLDFKTKCVKGKKPAIGVWFVASLSAVIMIPLEYSNSQKDGGNTIVICI